jgi:hypothetical protein
VRISTQQKDEVMTDVMVKLGASADNFSAFEIGAIHFIKNARIDDNPYEPGFFEYDSFFEGWAAARDGGIASVSPSLECRLKAALGRTECS